MLEVDEAITLWVEQFISVSRSCRRPPPLGAPCKFAALMIEQSLLLMNFSCTRRLSRTMSYALALLGVGIAPRLLRISQLLFADPQHQLLPIPQPARDPFTILYAQTREITASRKGTFSNYSRSVPARWSCVPLMTSNAATNLHQEPSGKLLAGRPAHADPTTRLDRFFQRPRRVS